MSSNSPLSTDTDSSTATSPPPAVEASSEQRLAKIQPTKQLQIRPTQVRISEGSEHAKTLQIGGAVLIGILGLAAWPFGLKTVSFVFGLGIVVMIVGLLTGRTTDLLRQTLARRRAHDRGQVTLTKGMLVIPTSGESMQFDLNDSHTLLRAWYRLEEDPSTSITSMLIAQDGQRAVLYSNEPAQKDDAMDHGFPSEQSLPFIKKPNEDYLCIPLEGMYTLSRMIDEYLRDLRDETAE